MQTRTKRIVAGLAAIAAIVVVATIVSTPKFGVERKPASTTESSHQSEFKALMPSANAAMLFLLSERYDRILTALPSRSDLHAASLDQQIAGHTFTPPAASDVPISDADSIVAILQTDVKTLDGRVIAQAFDSSSATWLSAAGCTVGNPATPVITYNPRQLVFLRPGVVRFLQWHELGHIQLHVNCGRQPQLLAGYKEKEADCWAVPRLLALGPAGDKAVTAAASFISTMGYDAQPNGPYETSAIGRGYYLDAHCH